MGPVAAVEAMEQVAVGQTLANWPRVKQGCVIQPFAHLPATQGYVQQGPKTPDSVAGSILLSSVPKFPGPLVAQQAR